MATRDEAQVALYSAAATLSEFAQRANPSHAAQLLIAASVAYRAAEGGPQVGNITLG